MRLVAGDPVPGRVGLERQTELLSAVLKAQGELIEAFNRALICNLELAAEIVKNTPPPDEDGPRPRLVPRESA